MITYQRQSIGKNSDEKQSLNEKLKLVIVTDYIKDEYYDIQNEEDIKVISG